MYANVLKVATLKVPSSDKLSQFSRIKTRFFHTVGITNGNKIARATDQRIKAKVMGGISGENARPRTKLVAQNNVVNASSR